MAIFSIYYGNDIVGHSALESGDPPMGVAFGVFKPSADYEKIQQLCRLNHADQSLLELMVKTQIGTLIPCVGVAILDYSNEMDELYIEVHVLGIDAILYQELFPEHITAYDNQFN